MEDKVVISTRIFQDADFDEISKWMRLRGFPPFDQKFLPKTGLVISLNREQMAMGFLCLNDSPIAFLCNVVSNPESDKESRKLCVDKLILELASRAKKLGYEHISCMTSVPALAERFKKLNYLKVEENITHFIGGL